MPTCWRRGARVGIGSVLLLIAGTGSAAALTRTWNGPSGGSWSVAANWLPTDTPQPSDVLVFPDTGGAATTVADGGPWTVSTLRFEGNWTVNGTASLQIEGIVTSGPAATVVINAPVLLLVDQNWTIDGPIITVASLSTGLTPCTITASATSHVVLGVIDGGGAIIKAGVARSRNPATAISRSRRRRRSAARSWWPRAVSCSRTVRP